MMKKTGQPDYILILVTIFLLALGILILASVTPFLSIEKFGIPYYYLNRHILFGLLPGIILAFFCYKIPLNFFRRATLILLLINLILMGLVLSPKIGVEFRGAARWIDLGPLSFQPSEFLKITFILYLAAWLSTQAQKNWNLTFIVFLIIILVISFLLISQPDISTLAVVIFVGTLMYFLAGSPFWQTILIILVGVGGLYSLIKLAPYRLARLLVFLRPETDPLGIGYQIKQALIAVGSGGIFGVGLGLSAQKFGFLPQTFSDSIFAIFAEETGFLGALILLSLFSIFFWQGFKIGKLARDKFSQILAWGISSWIILQAFVNIGSMIGILPLTGIPLPFISYGGSALASELIGVGILLNISKNV